MVGMVPVSIPDGELVRTWCAYGLGGNDMAPMNLFDNPPAKSIGDVVTQHDRIFRKLMDRTTALAKRAHRATGGMESLVHNWGNSKAKAIWQRAWDRWRRIDVIYQRTYRAALNRYLSTMNP